MILFDKDFAEQNAIVYYDCPNTSFIKMHIMLKKMGIKNNKFFLALYQSELRGVDPHSPNLTVDQKCKIAYECKINPWYFFYAVVRIPAAGEDGIPYVLNRANLALIWVYLNSIDSFLTMPRQIGKTIGSITLESYVLYILGMNMNIALFAKDNDLVLENVSRAKYIRDGLPDYLIFKTAKDSNNKEGLTYHHLNNSYKTFIAQSDSKRASGQGRGPSISSQHWDELAWYVNNHLSYPAATSATDTAGEQVRQAGIPCANIITTTAGKLDDPRGKYAYGIRSNCMRFTETLYDQPDQPSLYKIVAENSPNRMLYLEYSYKQLGKTDEWFARVTRGKDAERIAMDYLNKWIHGSGQSVLVKNILDRLDRSRREPTRHTYYKSLILKWFIPLEELDNPNFVNKTLVLSQDTSDNVGRDFTTLLILDPSNLSVVATCKCNQSNLTYIAKCVYTLLDTYKNMVFIPERNKNGAMMIDIILEMSEKDHTFNPFKRIYNTIVQEKEYSELHEYSKSNSNVDYTVRRKFGFTTSSGAAGRDMLYNNVLTAALEINADHVYDPDLIDELNALTTRQGRIDHSEGGHDDIVIAFLLACFLVLRAKNIQFYGLGSENTLTSINTNGVEIDPKEKALQQGYRDRISVLEEQIKTSRSDLLKSSYTRELNHIQKKIKDEYASSHVVSVGQIEQEVNVKRKEKKRRANGAAQAILKAFI